MNNSENVNTITIGRKFNGVRLWLLRKFVIWEEEIRNVFQSESIALEMPMFFWVQPFL